MLQRHQHEKKTLNSKYYDSEQLFYQTKNTEREINKQDLEKTKFKLVKRQKSW